MSEMCTCTFYKTSIDWDGADEQKGVIWSCSSCGKLFCESCFKERHGIEALCNMVKAESEEDILCPKCYKREDDEDA